MSGRRWMRYGGSWRQHLTLHKPYTKYRLGCFSIPIGMTLTTCWMPCRGGFALMGRRPEANSLLVQGYYRTNSIDSDWWRRLSRSLFHTFPNDGK